MSKKTYKKPKKIQFFYFFLVFITGISLFYIKTLPEKDQNVFVMLVLLFIMLYGLMKSTRNWAFDNPKNEEEENESKIVYKDKNIPSLEEMNKRLSKKNHKKS